MWVLLAEHGTGNVDVSVPDRDAGKGVGQEIAQRPTGPRPQRAEIQIRDAAAAADGHVVALPPADVCREIGEFGAMSERLAWS